MHAGVAHYAGAGDSYVSILIVELYFHVCTYVRLPLGVATRE